MNARARAAAGSRTAPARDVAVAILLAGAAILALPLQAQAQTTYVSNLNETQAVSLSVTDRQAQTFTTGAHAAGYAFSSVDVMFRTSGTVAASIYSTTGSDPYPDSELYSLIPPGTFNSSSLSAHTFTAPANKTLAASTTYAVVITPSGGSSTSIARTDSDAQSGITTNWGIGDAYHAPQGGSPPWGQVSNGRSLLIAVTGAGAVTPNSNPVFADTTLMRSVAENTATGTGIGAVIPAATDADTGDTLTYSLEGTDAASFDFDPSTRQIKTREALDFEARAGYVVTVKVVDGNGGSDTVVVTITVTDVDEAPGQPAAPSVWATPGSATRLDVSWEAPANTGPSITNYDLRYRQGTTGNFTNGPQNVTSTSSSISALVANTSYEVQVRATNAEGDGEWSPSGTGTPTDNAGVTISESSLMIEEGSSATYTVVLDTRPRSIVVVYPGTFDGSDFDGSDVSVDIPALSFTPQNWNTARTVTVTAAHDDDEDDEAVVTITHEVRSFVDTNYDGLSVGSVAVTVTDDDELIDVTVSFDESSALLTEKRHPFQGTLTVTVNLSADPEREVIIPLISEGGQGATSNDYRGVPESLTFNSGQSQKTFTFLAREDNVWDHNETVSISFGTLPDGVSTGTNEDILVTIEDFAVIQFGSTTYAVEEGSTVMPSVTMAEFPERGVTVPLTTTELGGASSDDYTVPLEATIAAGDGVGTFTFTAAMDEVDDSGESVKLAFGTLPAGLSAGSRDMATVFIGSPDVTVNFGRAAYTVAEGSNVTVKVKLDADPQRTVTIPISHRFQFGISPADYSGAPLMVTINSGDTEASFTFRATQDAIDDDGESVVLSFINLPGGVSEGNRDETTVSITDDDTAGVTVSETALTVTEADTIGASYTVVLDSRPTADVVVTVAGHSGTDVTPDTTTLTFTPMNWRTAQTVTVTAVTDADATNDTVSLTHSAASTDSDYSGITITGVTVTVEDDDTAGVTVSETALTVTEADTTGASYTVVLDSQPAADVVVTVAGHSGTDVTPDPDTLTFTPMNWETAQAVTVTAVTDADATNDTVSLTHSAASTDSDYSGITIGGVTVTVEDDTSNTLATGKPAISGTAQVGTMLTAMKGTIADANGTTKADNGDPGYAYSYQWLRVDGGTSTAIMSATASTYTPVAADVGKKVKVTVSFTDDGDTDEARTSDAYPSTGTIVSAALPELSFVPNTVTVNEDAVSATLTVELDPASTGTVTVEYATRDGVIQAAEAGEDYTATSGTLTFAATETSKTFTVPILDDDVYENDESFQVHLTNPTGATLVASGATVRIDSEDAVPTASMEAVTVDEGAGTMTLTLQLSHKSQPDITYSTSAVNVTGTATEGDDYDDFLLGNGRTARITVPGGGLSQVFAITIVDDSVDEPDETIEIGWQKGPNDEVTPEFFRFTGTFTDNDTAGVTVSKTALTVTEEDTTGDSYTVVLDSQPAADVVVTVAGHAGTEVTPDTTTLTFTSINWETAQTVTVTAVNDADTTNDTVTLTHSAASTDSDYSGITIGGVTVTVEDNDTAQVTGVMVAPGNARLTVGWAAVANATGYEVQWKSGGQSYNTSDRQATVASGSTTSHTLPGLANGTEYTVRVRATRTGANNGPYSDEEMATPKAAGVTVSKTALTVTEEDTTGDGYTVVLDSQPTANVVVTVAGHAGTEVSLTPTTLTFTTVNWETAQEVTVTATDDADVVDDTVSLTHSAASTDSDYDAIVISGVTVTIEDNDTAQVTGVMVAPGNARLTVGWAAVANATGYEVQWKSGGQSYNTSDRQATVASGSTTSHTLPGLANDTEYTVRVRATRTGANDGPYSDEEMATPKAAGVTVSKTALTVTEEDTTGDSYTVVLDSQPTANVVVTVAGHAGTEVSPTPTTLTFTTVNWETAQEVTVTATDDADVVDDTVSLTHSAASTDSDFSGITISGVTVTVNDDDTANSAPSFTSAAAFDAAENQTAVGTVVASDSDADDSVTGYTIQGGADRSRFSIVEAAGVLTFASAPNFEAPADADTDNAYVVVVRATSGTGGRRRRTRRSR